VPKVVQIKNSPRRNPASPTRFTTNAFSAAAAAAGLSNQNPIKRYEQSPTPSQPTNKRRKLSAKTNRSMKKAKRLRKAKYLA